MGCGSGRPLQDPYYAAEAPCQPRTPESSLKEAPGLSSDQDGTRHVEMKVGNKGRAKVAAAQQQLAPTTPKAKAADPKRSMRSSMNPYPPSSAAVAGLKMPKHAPPTILRLTCEAPPPRMPDAGAMQDSENLERTSGKDAAQPVAEPPRHRVGALGQPLGKLHYRAEPETRTQSLICLRGHPHALQDLLGAEPWRPLRLSPTPRLASGKVNRFPYEGIESMCLTR